MTAFTEQEIGGRHSVCVNVIRKCIILSPMCLIYVIWKCIILSPMFLVHIFRSSLEMKLILLAGLEVVSIVPCAKNRIQEFPSLDAMKAGLRAVPADGIQP